MHDSFCFTTEIGEESTSKYQKLRRVTWLYIQKKNFLYKSRREKSVLGTFLKLNFILN